MSGDEHRRANEHDTDRRPDTPRETDEWPVTLTGVTETVVTTMGPNGRWNAAALGLFAGDDGGGDCDGDVPEDDGDADDDRNAVRGGAVTAKTWGNTRTRRNFHREGEGYVQFTVDPVDFVDAALSISELEGSDPILESADAWVRVAAQRVDAGEDDGTEWEAWALTPLESTVCETRVPTISRGFGAVVEATVAASRLGVPGYDENTLRERLEWCATVVERTGSDRERAALDRIREHAEW